MIWTVIGKWVIRGIRILKKITEYLDKLNFFKWIKCGFEVYTWFMTMKFFINFLLSMIGVDEIPSFLDALGIGSLNSINSILNSDLGQLEIPRIVAKTRELGIRADMTQSSLNGSHKPNYHSTVVYEAVYAYDNIKGKGQLILIFNPEGFGWKPRNPQIITNVSEAEAFDFFSAKSWGLFWRNNFMIKRNFNYRYKVKDELTDEEMTLEPSKDLNVWLEEKAMLSPLGGEQMSEIENENITAAIDSHVSVVDKFINSIENGTFGTEEELAGIAIKDALGQRIRNIPNDLKGVISSNPFIKELAPYTAAFKKAKSTWISLKTGIASSGFYSTFKSEGLSMIRGVNPLTALYTVTGIKVNAINQMLIDGTFKALTTGSVRGFTIKQALQDERMKLAQTSAKAKFQASNARNYGKNKTYTYEKYLKKKEEFLRYKQKTNPNFTQKITPRETWEAQNAVRRAKWEEKKLAEFFEIAKEELTGGKYLFFESLSGIKKMLKPPTCFVENFK